MSVNNLESRLSTYERYEKELTEGKIARFVSKAFHDEAYENMPPLAQKIYDQKLYDSLTIYNRRKETVFESTRDKHKLGVSLISVIKTDRNQPWSREKYNNYIKRADVLLQSMTARGEEDKYIKEVQGLKHQAQYMLQDKQKQSKLQKNPKKTSINSTFTRLLLTIASRKKTI